MKVGLKDAYLDAVEQFLDKNSKKKMAGGTITLNGKYPDTVMIRDSYKNEIRGYTLGKKNARSMLKLNQQFLDGFFPYFKLTLLGEGERRLGNVIYVKSRCSNASFNMLLGPITQLRGENIASAFGINTKRTKSNIIRSIPSGDLIAGPMVPLKEEESLSYDFDKSPRPNTTFLTCALAGGEGPLGSEERRHSVSKHKDFPSKAIGYVFVDKKGSYARIAKLGSGLSIIERGRYNNAIWFGYIFLKHNVAKQLKSGKMEVITAELN